MKYMYLRLIRSRPKAWNKVTIQHNHLNRKKIWYKIKKYKCKNNIKLIYLTFKHCTNKQTIGLDRKLDLTNDNKFDDWRSNHSEKARHVMRTCVLPRPIAFLRVRCSICVPCSILILLIKTVCFSIVLCSIPHCILNMLYCVDCRVHVSI